MNLKETSIYSLCLLQLPLIHPFLYTANPVSPEFPILAWYSILPDSAQTRERYDELREAGFKYLVFYIWQRADRAKFGRSRRQRCETDSRLGPLYSDTKATVDLPRQRRSGRMVSARRTRSSRLR